MNRAQRRAASRRDRPRRIPLPTARPLSLQRVGEIIEEMYDAEPECAGGWCDEWVRRLSREE